MFLERKQDRDLKKGWIEVISGSMFSGKTEELIRRLKRAQIAKQSVEIFKPSVDTRYDKEDIVSHDRTQIPSRTIHHSSQILILGDQVDVLGIDEAQFFDDGLIDVCNKLANRGTRVILAGLDMDFQGKPFGPIPQLLACAEFVTKVHAICMDCGEIAHFSKRISPIQDQILLGEQDNYRPLCRRCYNAQN